MAGKKKNSAQAQYLSRLIRDFIEDYAVNSLQRSKHTIKSYEDALSLYLLYLEEEKGIDGSTLSFDCFKSGVIEDWLKWLVKERKNSPQTANYRLAAIRKFLTFLKIKEPTLRYLSDEARDIERRKTPKVKVKGMSTEAIGVLLEMPNTHKRTGRRDQALYTLMYTTATRVDEVLSLKVKDLFLKAKKPYIVVCHGKGDKPRNVPVTKKAAAILKNYLEEFHGPKPLSEAYVFYSRNGGPKTKMTSQNVLDRLKGYARKANVKHPEVPADTHCHTLRHARATHWLENGMNVMHISQLLGHESLETTRKYLDIEPDELAKYLAVTEAENESGLEKNYGKAKGGLAGFCGIRRAVSRKVTNT